MSETANIAKMAEKLSKELFSEFNWEQVGPMNWNWPCEDKHRHNTNTHPSDVVFHYNEPYMNARTFINCDLKSYARGSINAGSVRVAVESLARSLNCAEKSMEWQRKYVHKNISPEICGLLFIYNHDGEYDKEFASLLNGVKHDKLDIPKKSKIVVMGPHDIHWLNNVRHEIVQMRGTGHLPPRDKCGFFYPHLVLRKNIQFEKARAATLEMLTAPWIILTAAETKQHVIFYRRKGESVDEFLYLIDYLMHYQVLTGETEVQIKTLDSASNAAAYFGKAVDQYIDECEGSPEMKKQLKAIKYGQINHVQTKFSELEIGMENG